MQAQMLTAERLPALAELYQQGQGSELRERTLEKLLPQEAARCQPRAANYRLSWTREDGTSAIKRRCSLSLKVS